MIVQTAAPGLTRIGPRVAAGLRIHGEKDAMTDRPNILFILTDQQSATIMGCRTASIFCPPSATMPELIRPKA